MEFLATPWPNLRLYAKNLGTIDPYDPANASLFRGEEAFAPEVEGWQRWSKPSPEPRLDEDFEFVVLEAVIQQSSSINTMVRLLAAQLMAANPEPPVLVAILRAGVPISALLAPLLEEHYGTEIPVCAFSLFYGLGWDDKALEAILADFPNRPLIFVDGWTSGGGVATQLEQSYAAWVRKGGRAFAGEAGPQFAVLCDPRGRAQYSALQADFFVPSAVFTAPETLGFSRGFAFEHGGMFGVYEFPAEYWKPAWIQSWFNILDAPTAFLPPDAEPNAPLAPNGFRVHVNEVVRALINRNPIEIWLAGTLGEAETGLAPLLHLAYQRTVPIGFNRPEVATWGAKAAARMK